MKKFVLLALALLSLASVAEANGPRVRRVAPVRERVIVRDRFRHDFHDRIIVAPVVVSPFVVSPIVTMPVVAPVLAQTSCVGVTSTVQAVTSPVVQPVLTTGAAIVQPAAAFLAYDLFNFRFHFRHHR
jgi:hypothetical protein